MPADTPKPAAPVTKPAKGELLGHIDGKPVFAKDDGSADHAPPVAANLPLRDWHAAFTERTKVTLVKPRRTVRGRVFPEKRGDVMLGSARSVVAHRVLHGMSPDELKALRAAFEASSPKDASRDAFEMWALRHIDGQIPATVAGFALQKTLAVIATPAKLHEHKKAALASAPAPSPAS